MIRYPLHSSKYFDVREWVDQRTWNSLGVKAAWMIDPRIVRVADLLREKLGAPIQVNNWHYRREGQPLFDSSGFRSIWDQTGGKLSQHRAGRAVDMRSAGITPMALHNIIMAHKAEFLAAGLTTMEDVKFTPSWLHCDCRPLIPGVAPENDFLIVRP